MIIWNNNLSGGINQNTPGLSAINEHDLLVDLTQVQAGNLAHRLGTDRFLSNISSSNQIRGLHEYKKQDGVNYFHTVSGGNLYINDTSAWALQDSSEWAATSEVDMANFINRHYMASSVSGEYLKYATETSTVTTPVVWTATASSSSTGSTLVATGNVFSEFMVGWTINNTTDGATRTITAYTNATTVTVNSAINDTWDGDTLTISLDGKYLAVNGAYMMLAGNSTFPRRTFYSNVDSGNFSLQTDFFITSQPPTGVASFGNGKTFIIFTRSGYMIADPAQPQYTTEVEGFGCVSHRTVQVVKGGMIYLSDNGFNYIAANEGVPTDISRKITNDLTTDALINKITKSNLTVTAAGVIGDIYYCAVRDLSSTVKGVTLESAVFVIDMSQNNWKVETYPVNNIGSVFARFTNSSGETNLYAGSFTTGTVYKMAVPGLYTDDDKDGTTNAVTATWISKHYEWSNSKNGAIKDVITQRLWFKYKSASTISVSYSLNGSTTYTALALLPIYTDTQWSYNSIDLGAEGRTISLKLSFTGECIIYAIGFEAELEAGTGIKGL